MHRNGALCEQEVFTFFAGFERPRPQPTDDEHGWPTHDFGTPDAYQFFLDLGPLSELGADDFGAEIAFWNDAVAHPDYDQFWQDRVLRPHLTNVHAATMVVGGFYDTEDLYGTLEVYHGIEEHNPHTANTLVMGPWRHGGWHDPANQHLGDADFGFRTDDQFEALLLAFLRHHLKGAPDPQLPEAYVFESGANRWRSFSQWPPKQVVARSYWLADAGVLATDAPAATDGFDEFPSDPNHPVPYTADPKTAIWSAGYMAEDQRFASRRPDVLTYQTPPLDRDVTLAGPIDVELAVSTTGTDADWVVKLVDASPGKMPGWTTADIDAGKPDLGGRQILVRGEPFRGRYRNSLQHPEAFVPGQVAVVKFTLDDVMHTFQRGHRIMIQVQSSWFPFIDRNPQTFVPSIYAAKRADFVMATHRVHRGSKITVRVLPAADDVTAR
jgi:putative CocE/NonD family hydrolase